MFFSISVDVCKLMRDELWKWVECDDPNNDNPSSCKGWLRTRNSSLYNCDAFCKSLGPGYACYEAYKEEQPSSNCDVREENEMGCSGPNNDDYICGCERLRGSFIPVSKFNFISRRYKI